MSYYNNSQDTGFANALLSNSAFCRSALSVILFAKKISAVLVDAVVVSGSPENEPLTKTEVNKKANKSLRINQQD